METMHHSRLFDLMITQAGKLGPGKSIAFHSSEFLTTQRWDTVP